MRFAAEEGGCDEELQKESCVVANRVSAVMAKRPVITPPAVMGHCERSCAQKRKLADAPESSRDRRMRLLQSDRS